MVMKKIILLIPFLLMFLLPQKAFAQDWSYPLEKTLERSSDKSFGQYIDKNFYIGKENLFPNQFFGYHAGVDLEIFPEELNQEVQVLAITSGTLSFIGQVSGYGGLILEQLDNQDLTVLYGHLKLQVSSLKVGDKVQAGQKIASLGNAFSRETGRERKHLHFGIYKGHDLSFKGYEISQNNLEAKWIDPLKFLQNRILVSPTESLIPTPTINQKIPQKSTNPLVLLIELVKNFFAFLSQLVD